MLTEAELYERRGTLLAGVSGAGYGGSEHIDADVPAVSLPSITRHGDAGPHIPAKPDGGRPIRRRPTHIHHVQTGLGWSKSRSVHFFEKILDFLLIFDDTKNKFFVFYFFFLDVRYLMIITSELLLTDIESSIFSIEKRMR